MVQAYEEFDEEVQDAEDLETRALSGASAASADRDDEIKPYIHKWVCAALCGGVLRCTLCGHTGGRHTPRHAPA